VAAHCKGERITAKSCVLAAGGFESNREWLREAWGQNERGEWPADNFLIRGTAYNKGVLLKHLLDDHGADRIGDPTQAHMVAIDARAPLYDGGICTRIDCVSLGVVVNREASASTTRARTSGPSATPSGAAWWRSSRGRLAIRSSTARPLAASCRRCSPASRPTACPSWRKSWACPWTPSPARSMPTTPPAAWARSTTPRWTTATPKASRPPRRTGRGPSTPAPFYGYALKPGVTFTYLGLHTDDTAAVRFNNQPSPNLFVAGEMMAGNVLGKGYTAGVGMSIGTAFGRIAGTNAAPLWHQNSLAALIHKARKQLQKQEQTMQALEALTRDARALANGEIVLSAPEAEVARQMQICNACRYCEGFCAVFPAMTRRLEFGKADIHFMANLCHNCGACLHACQYAPPHEFAVNVPQAMAQVRGQTYADYAWPPALGQLYQRNGLTLALALVAGLTLFLLLAVVLQAAGLGARCGAPRGRQLLRHLPAQPAGGPVCAGVPVCGAGPGPGRAPLLARCDARHQRRAAERARHGRGHRRRAAPQVPGRRPRRRLPQRGRRLHPVAPRCTTSRSTASCCALPPPAWPRCTTTCWLARPVRPAQPAQAAGRRWRREPG
jgi:ferredoxin